MRRASPPRPSTGFLSFGAAIGHRGILAPCGRGTRHSNRAIDLSTERPTSIPTASPALTRKLERREEELAFLAEITHALAVSGASPPLHGLILERAAILLGCESIALAAAAEDARDIELVAAQSGGRAAVGRQPIPGPDALVETVLSGPRTVPLHPGDWTGASPLLQHLLGGRPFLNGLAVSCTAPGEESQTERSLFLLALNRPEPFQPEDVRLLLAFADQLAIAEAIRAHPRGEAVSPRSTILDAAPRVADVRNAEGASPGTIDLVTAQLRVQDAILGALCAHCDEEALVERTLEAFRTGLGAEKVELLLDDAEGVRRRVSAPEGPPPRPTYDASKPPWTGPALVRETVRLGTESVSDEVPGMALDEGVPAVLTVPVRADERLLGTLVVAWAERPKRVSPRYPQPEGERKALCRLAAHFGRALVWWRTVRRAVLEADALELLAAEQARTLTRTREQLVRSQWLASLGELAAGVAHDLNNALNPIVAFAELIRENQDQPEKIRTYAERILMAAQGGAETVRRIQRFTRRRLGALPLETISVAALIDEAIELTRPNWHDRTNGGPVSIERSIEEGLEVEGNPGELRQALLNLVTNALDAMQGGGTLRFVAKAVGEEVLLGVQDTGEGMPADILERALEPFFTTKGVRGTGLGLSEVFGIARRHGGRLELETWAGVGTSILLRLPTARLESRRHPTRTRPEVPSQPYRVLLVDDNVLSLEATAASLRSAGHTVATAARAGDALRVFQTGRYDLVFSDLGLPDMSGWDLLEQLREIDPKVRLGVITGWSLPESDDELARRGIELVFIKPVDPDDLLASL